MSTAELNLVNDVVAKSKIIVVGTLCWGKGDTFNEAYENCKKHASYGMRKYVAYLVDPEAYCNDLGAIIYSNKTFEPKLIMTKGIKTKK